MSSNIKCRIISKGKDSGNALVTKDPISFLGGVDPKTGIVIDKKHEYLQVRDLLLDLMLFTKWLRITQHHVLLFVKKLNQLLLLEPLFLKYQWLIILM